MQAGRGSFVSRVSERAWSERSTAAPTFQFRHVVVVLEERRGRRGREGEAAVIERGRFVARFIARSLDARPSLCSSSEEDILKMGIL